MVSNLVSTRTPELTYWNLCQERKNQIGASLAPAWLTLVLWRYTDNVDVVTNAAWTTRSLQTVHQLHISAKMLPSSTGS